jgi:hypothetical protein
MRLVDFGTLGKLTKVHMTVDEDVYQPRVTDGATGTVRFGFSWWVGSCPRRLR